MHFSRRIRAKHKVFGRNADPHSGMKGEWGQQAGTAEKSCCNTVKSNCSTAISQPSTAKFYVQTEVKVLQFSCSTGHR